MTLTCYNFEFSQNFAGFREFVWEPTAAKRIRPVSATVELWPIFRGV